MTHLKWHLLSIGDQELLDRLQQDQQHLVEEGRPRPGDQANKLDHKEPEEVPDTTEAVLSITETNQNVGVEDSSEGAMTDAGAQSAAKHKDWGEEEGDSSFWGTEEISAPITKKSPDSAAASWESSGSGNADFWGTESASSTSASRLPHSTPAASWEMSGSGDSDFREVQSSVDSLQAVSEDQHRSCKSLPHFGTKNLSTTDLSLAVQLQEKTSAGEQSAMLCDTNTNTADRHTSTEESTLRCAANESTSLNNKYGEELTASSDRECHTAEEEAMVEEPALSESEADKDPQGNPNPNVEWSEFCEDNDNVPHTDGRTFFVVPDSDDEEILADGRLCRTKTKWKPVIKCDPFTVRETLHLSYEEVCMSVDGQTFLLVVHWWFWPD